MNLLLGSVGVFWALQLIFAYQVVRKEEGEPNALCVSTSFFRKPTWHAFLLQ